MNCYCEFISFSLSVRRLTLSICLSSGYQHFFLWLRDYFILSLAYNIKFLCMAHQPPNKIQKAR